MTWAPALVVDARRETGTARTLVLEVAGWPGHTAGQHVDVRLTADDGYTAVRSYSIASSASSRKLEITVDRLDDGEVSPYLVDVLAPGDRGEIRGPAGGGFVWRPAAADDATPPRPVQLIGGGSGIVPLMAMIRTHRDRGDTTPFRLLYSVRSPELALYRDELLELDRVDAGVEITWAFTRATPPGWPTAPARLDAAAVAAAAYAPDAGAAVFVCGATPFVEAVASWLVAAGHDAALIKTERYGGTEGVSA